MTVLRVMHRAILVGVILAMLSACTPLIPAPASTQLPPTSPTKSMASSILPVSPAPKSTVDTTPSSTSPRPTAPVPNVANHAELTLTLSLETDTFGLGEEVSVTLQLQNMGTESVLVHTRMAMGDPALPKSMRDIVFEITNPSGKELPFRIFADLAASQPSDFRTLKPGESFQLSYYLDVAYSFDLPGRYRIKAIYNNQFDPGTGATAWKGELNSNTMTFTIEP